MDAYSCLPDLQPVTKPKDCQVIHQGSKMKTVIDRAEQYLLKHKSVKLTASGKAINKIVSVVEILKRKNQLYQYNHLSSYVHTDLWVAQEPLDSIKVEKHEPILTITLSFTRLNDIVGCTEQIPL